MRIELIQPFINAADAVLAEMLKAPSTVTEVSMDEEVYRRKGVAASVAIHGDIEGQVIFDLESSTALQVAAVLAGGKVDAHEQIARETVCELANMVVGNAVTLLNDKGYNFKVFPPKPHTSEKGYAGNCEREAAVMCFDTPSGKVFVNIALDYSHRSSTLAPQTPA